MLATGCGRGGGGGGAAFVRRRMREERELEGGGMVGRYTCGGGGALGKYGCPRGARCNGWCAAAKGGTIGGTARWCTVLAPE